MRYTAKYRMKGQWFWTPLKNIVGDGLENGFKFFSFEDGSMRMIPLDAEVHFGPDRAKSIEKAMSKEAGTPIQSERG